MSIRKFNRIKKEQEVKKLLDLASLYIIAKREVPNIVLSNKMFIEGVEETGNSIPLSITMKEAGIRVNAIYVLPPEFGRDVVDEMKKMISSDVELDELLYCSAIGCGKLYFEPSDDLIHFVTYEVLYVGECVDEPLTKRFKAHHALQEMLIEEDVISRDYANSDELILLPFRIGGDVLSILDPYTSGIDDYLKVFTNDLSFGTKEITLDCEKALVHGMNPKYNRIRFLNYPQSEDGLSKTEADVYSYYVGANLVLKYDGGVIYGSSDDYYVSHIIGDKDGYTNIYAPSEDFTKRYVRRMFPYYPSDDDVSSHKKSG